MFAAGRMLAAALAALFALGAPPDAAPHTRRMIQVNGARLELLDFGGRGPLMIFLPGFRNTAHVFDDLAPEFTDHFHVVALTPRGIPVSSAPDSGYTIAQLAADVHTVIDSLGAHSAILAGHSIAGAIMTRFGEAYPAQLTAAIYLDASFDYASAARRGTRPGKPVPVDVTSATFVKWENRYGAEAWSPSVTAAAQADRDAWEIDSSDVARRLALTEPLRAEVRSHPHEPWRNPAPSLALCSVSGADRAIGWLTPDSTRWADAKRFYDEDAGEQRSECMRFAQRSRNAMAIEVDSRHYVFFDQRDLVVWEMRAFLLPFK